MTGSGQDRRRRPTKGLTTVIMAVAIMAVAITAAACGGTGKTPAATSTSGTAAVSTPTSAGTASSARSTVSPSGWPGSIVVLGHSGATGQNSDPAHPGADVPRNSWATGSNPKVNSIYLRILAHNPAIRNHAVNLARDGATVNDLASQARAALALTPRPELFLIQTIDADIRCDGTDPQHYAVFAAALTSTLRLISTSAPRAWIFLVTQPGDVANNAAVAATNPAWVKGWQGTGPCDAFNLAGKLAPAHVAGLQSITDHYFAAQAASCQRFARCRTDSRAWQRMIVTAADFSDDGNHPTVAGLAKRADVTWTALQTVGVLPRSR